MRKCRKMKRCVNVRSSIVLRPPAIQSLLRFAHTSCFDSVSRRERISAASMKACGSTILKGASKRKTKASRPVHDHDHGHEPIVRRDELSVTCSISPSCTHGASWRADCSISTMPVTSQAF